MIRETFMLARREIRRNVLRSFLTMLGIVIGVAAVITMVTLGSGATARVTDDIAKLGSNLLQVRPGQGFRGPGGTRSAAKMFNREDADAIFAHVSGLAAVAPMSSRSTQVIFGNENRVTTVSGSTNAFLTARSWNLADGRIFTEAELCAGQPVCILGATVRKELFGGQNPVGNTVRLQRYSCRVIGALESKGQSNFGTDQDDFILIPLRTFQRRIAGDTDVGVIFVSARDGVSTAKVQQDIESLMRERRRVAPGKEDDFNVRDMKEIMNTLTGTTRVLTALLSAVAGAFLFSGAVGVFFGYFPARKAARLDPIEALRHE